MKTAIFLLMLVGLASCANVRKIVKSQYNHQQPVRIEVEQEPERSNPVEAEVAESLPEEKQPVVAPVRGLQPVRQRVAAAPTQKELEQEARREAEEEKIVEDQNKNAKYSFASAVDDGIMDHSHVRQEQRDGQRVTGSYSYSDGYVKRTVTYEADENGYRVVSEESEPIGNGPTIDLKNGKADVHTQYEGVDTKYSINADDIAVQEPVNNHSNNEEDSSEEHAHHEPEQRVAPVTRNRSYGRDRE